MSTCCDKKSCCSGCPEDTNTILCREDSGTDDTTSYSNNSSKILSAETLKGKKTEETSLLSSPSSPVVAIPNSSGDDFNSPASRKKRKARKALIGALVFCFLFMLLELGGGFYADSLALINDGAHQLTDVANLAMSLVALQASAWKSSSKYTYGWKRAEVVGALTSVFTVWAIVGFILIEAVHKSFDIIKCAELRQNVRSSSEISALSSAQDDCEGIDAPVMLGIGAAGIIANAACALVLAWGGHSHSHGIGGFGEECSHGHSHGPGGGHGHSAHAADDDSHHHSHDHHGHSHHACNGDAADHDHDHSHSHDHGHSHGGGGDVEEMEDLNLRSGFVHMVADCIQSLGVVIAAGIIWYFNWVNFGSAKYAYSYYNLADPICSVIFAVLMIFTTTKIFKDLFCILMQCVPPNIKHDDILSQIENLEGVEAVEDLHIWALGSTNTVCTIHLVARSLAQAQQVIAEATKICRSAGIEYSTIQVNEAVALPGEEQRCPCKSSPGF